VPVCSVEPVGRRHSRARVPERHGAAARIGASAALRCAAGKRTRGTTSSLGSCGCGPGCPRRRVARLSAARQTRAMPDHPGLSPSAAMPAALLLRPGASERLTPRRRCGTRSQAPDSAVVRRQRRARVRFDKELSAGIGGSDRGCWMWPCESGIVSRRGTRAPHRQASASRDHWLLLALFGVVAGAARRSADSADPTAPPTTQAPRNYLPVAEIVRRRCAPGRCCHQRRSSDRQDAQRPSPTRSCRAGAG
jgi:hypothetical protein